MWEALVPASALQHTLKGDDFCNAETGNMRCEGEQVCSLRQADLLATSFSLSSAPSLWSGTLCRRPSAATRTCITSWCEKERPQEPSQTPACSNCWVVFTSVFNLGPMSGQPFPHRKFNCRPRVHPASSSQSPSCHQRQHATPGIVDMSTLTGPAR